MFAFLVGRLGFLLPDLSFFGVFEPGLIAIFFHVINCFGFEICFENLIIKCRPL